jgi:hypothetical protein
MSVPAFEDQGYWAAGSGPWPMALAAAREGRHHAEQASVAQGKIP